MSANKAFLTALAYISILFLFLAATFLIPLGSYWITLPCFAIKVAGIGILTAGVYSLWHFLRLLIR